MLRSTSFSHFQSKISGLKYISSRFNRIRFFSTKPNLLLPSIKKNIFPLSLTLQNPWLIGSKDNIHERLDHEYKTNEYAQPILKGAEFLLQQQQLTVDQSVSIKEDQDILSQSIRGGSLFYYLTEKKSVHIPYDIFSPYALQSSVRSANYNFHKNELNYFSSGIIHEFTHAVDHLLADLAVTKIDRINISEDYEWLENGLDFNYYEKPEMRALCKAIQADWSELERMAPLDDQAKQFLYFINIIDGTYSRYDFLDEMKSLLVEFSTVDAFGPKLVQQYLPQTSKWFFEQFVPKIEHSMSQQAEFELKP